MKAGTTAGSSLSERAASLGSIAGMLGRAQKHKSKRPTIQSNGSANDCPFRIQNAAKLERAIDDEVETAVAAALRSLEARS